MEICADAATTDACNAFGRYVYIYIYRIAQCFRNGRRIEKCNLITKQTQNVVIRS